MRYIILIGDENFNLNAIKAIEHHDSLSNHNVGNDRYTSEERMKQYTISYTTNYTTVTNERGTQLKTTYTALVQFYEVIDVATDTVISHNCYDSLSRLVSESDLVHGGTKTYTCDYLSRITVWLLF